MTAAQILGALLVAMPFVAIAAFVVREMGWKELLMAYGGAAALVAIIAAGVYLMTGELS